MIVKARDECVEGRHVGAGSVGSCWENVSLHRMHVTACEQPGMQGTCYERGLGMTVGSQALGGLCEGEELVDV